MASRLVIGGMAQDYLEIWRKQYAVKTTVSFLARNIAQLGLPVYRRKGDNDRERLIDHPLAALINRPNPWTTRYRFLDALIHDMAIFDRSYWLKTKGANSGTFQLTRLDPRLVTPKGDLGGYPTYFEFRGERGKADYPADQVLFFRGYSGGMSDIGGVPPIESLREVLEEAYFSSTSRAQTVRNGARISGYITRPKDAKWSDESRTRFRQSWAAQYTGDGPGTGGTPILEDGMEFKEASFSPKDLQYVEARKLTREEVAAAYYIPPPMLGLLENATFSNIVQQHKSLYSDTLGPWLKMIQDELALQLIPDLPDSDDVYVEFNIDEKLRGDFEQRQEAIAKSTGAPWRTVNEARALENLPPMDGGDDLIRPLNVTQNGDQDPIEAEPGDPAEEAPFMEPTGKPDDTPEEDQEG